MGCLNCVQIILFLLPVLINSQIETLEKQCYRITCANYKTNNTKCDHVGHLQDPFNNECVAKCDGPCINNYCDYCVCHSTDTTAIMLAQLTECKRILNGTYYEGGKYKYYAIRFCNNNYIINPYDPYECLQRCDGNSCGSRGTCSPLGHCVCHLGYRPDVRNPRHCVKISKNNPTIPQMTCHIGFKLRDGKCVSACGDCKNGYCGTDGVCRCWDDYELDVANSTCRRIKMSCSSDSCLNGVCDSGGICQCPDCSDFINKTMHCQNKSNSTVGDAAKSKANENCGNTIPKGNMIFGSPYKMIIIILSCIAVILLIFTFSLNIILLRK